MKVRYKKNRTPLVYDPEWLPTIPHEPPEPVCGPFERCADCPYPGHGFVCWGADEEKCLRTEVARIMERGFFHAWPGRVPAQDSEKKGLRL